MYKNIEFLCVSDRIVLDRDDYYFPGDARDIWRQAMTEDLSNNERRFIRHPSSIPITCCKEGHSRARRERMRDISLGGLAFSSGVQFEQGDCLQVCYPLFGHGLCVHGEVIWCACEADPASHCFSCGLRFQSGEMLFRARLVEQMCHIEAYRHAQERQGRQLTSEEAALEWIPNVAHRFPSAVAASTV